MITAVSFAKVGQAGNHSSISGVVSQTELGLLPRRHCFIQRPLRHTEAGCIVYAHNPDTGGVAPNVGAFALRAVKAHRVQSTSPVTRIVHHKMRRLTGPGCALCLGIAGHANNTLPPLELVLDCCAYNEGLARSTQAHNRSGRDVPSDQPGESDIEVARSVLGGDPAKRRVIHQLVPWAKGRARQYPRPRTEGEIAGSETPSRGLRSWHCVTSPKSSRSQPNLRN